MLKIPVIGVFYNETDLLANWLSSVEKQGAPDIKPVPIIVVSRHPDHVDKIALLLGKYIQANRIEEQNVEILRYNAGPTQAFNLAASRYLLRNKDCQWIASLDPDATFALGAIQEMVLSGARSPQIGMVSPIIVSPRPDRDFQRVVTDEETACQAGHYPRNPAANSSKLLRNYWSSHFKGWTIREVKQFLAQHPEVAPFCACFCASLWRATMFDTIGYADGRQFRTLNCGEIGYRAQLSGWSGAFAPRAMAFHGNPPEKELLASKAMNEKGGAAWLYYHAQALIALKYFPNNIRNIAARDGERIVTWDTYFPELSEVSQQRFDEELRVRLVERWSEFIFERT
jgi:GT2 family glycosyltransferase